MSEKQHHPESRLDRPVWHALQAAKAAFANLIAVCNTHDIPARVEVAIRPPRSETLVLGVVTQDGGAGLFHGCYLGGDAGGL